MRDGEHALSRKCRRQEKVREGEGKRGKAMEASHLDPKDVRAAVMRQVVQPLAYHQEVQRACQDEIRTRDPL